MGFGQGTCSQFKVRRNQVNQRNILYIQQRSLREAGLRRPLPGAFVFQIPYSYRPMVSIFFPFFNYILFFRNAISYQLCLSLHLHTCSESACFTCQLEIYNNNSYRTSISAILSTHLLPQPPEYICFYNAIRDEERRAVTSADRRTA